MGSRSVVPTFRKPVKSRDILYISCLDTVVELIRFENFANSKPAPPDAIRVIETIE